MDKKYMRSADELLLIYKRNAQAAHEMKHYAMRDKWCQKHDVLALKVMELRKGGVS